MVIRFSVREQGRGLRLLWGAITSIITQPTLYLGGIFQEAAQETQLLIKCATQDMSFPAYPLVMALQTPFTGH